VFPAEEAFSIAQKLEIHYTPKQGSWVNIIEEIELSGMTSQSLDQRIDRMEKFSGEVEAWQIKRDEKQKTVKRQFTYRRYRDKIS
jgi:hypothetical protein